ncbi:MAG: hypothetical protein FD126_2814, partial [Elusimicrobia bacterium]
RRAGSERTLARTGADVDALTARVVELRAAGGADWRAQADRVSEKMAALRKTFDGAAPGMLGEDRSAAEARFAQLRTEVAGWLGGQLPTVYQKTAEDIHSLVADAPNRLAGASERDLAAWQTRSDALRARLFGEGKDAGGREGSEWARLEALADMMGPDAPDALKAARAKAQTLRGLLEAMKEGGVDATALPPEMKAHFLGTVRDGSETLASAAQERLGVLGQAAMAQRGKSEGLAVLLAALKDRKINLSGPNAQADLTAFFDQAARGEVSVVFEGARRKVDVSATDIAPLVQRMSGRPAAPKEGEAPAPAPSEGERSSAFRDLVTGLTAFRLSSDDAPDRAEGRLFLSHANLNRAVYDYLKGLPEGDPDRVKRAEFLQAYDRAYSAKPVTSPGLAQLRAQQDLTDGVRDLVQRFPEYRAMTEANKANAVLNGRLAELTPQQVQALQAAGAPDIANLTQRVEKQGALQLGIAAFALGLPQKDPKAWEAARNDLLRYYYGEGYDDAVTSQRDAMRTAGRSRDAGALATTLDGVVSPVFMSSGFLTEVPKLLERQAAGRTSGRDQPLLQTWSAVAQSLKKGGATDADIAALAADPAALAGRLRQAGIPVYDRTLLEAAAG